MHRAAPCPTDEFLWTIAVARLVLPPDIHLQAPPNLSDDLGPLLESGIDDWGGVSPVTADHVNPERAWPALGILRAATEAAGHTLAPRLTLYPEFALDPDRWLDRAMRFPVLDASDAEGLGRDHPWCSGGEVPPPQLVGPVGRRRRRWSCARCRSPVTAPVGRGGRRAGRCEAGQEVDEDEIVTLFGARGPEVRAVAEVADAAAGRAGRRRGDLRRQPQHQLHQRLHLQVPVLRLLQGAPLPQPPGHPLPARAERDHRPGTPRPRSSGPPRSACRAASTPSSTATTTSRSSRRSGRRRPTIHIHGFTALEVTEGARRSACRWPTTWALLRDAGLQDPARHRRRDPRRRGAGRPVPRQDRHRAVARRPPHRPPGRPAVQRHHHVRGGRTAAVVGPPPGPHPRPAEGDRRVHRVRPAAVRAHGHPHLPPAAAPAGAPPSARRCSCTPSGGSPTGTPSTTSRSAG